MGSWKLSFGLTYSSVSRAYYFGAMEFDFSNPTQKSHSVWVCEGGSMVSPITNLYPLPCLLGDISRIHFSTVFAASSISKHHLKSNSYCTLHHITIYSFASM